MTSCICGKNKDKQESVATEINEIQQNIEDTLDTINNIKIDIQSTIDEIKNIKTNVLNLEIHVIEIIDETNTTKDKTDNINTLVFFNPEK